MRKIVFLVLLVSTVLFGATKNFNNLRVEDLNEAQLKKLTELSEISKKIAERQALLIAWGQQVRSLVVSMPESDDELMDTIRKFGQTAEKAFLNKGENLKNLLAEKLSVTDYELDFIKVWVIRRHFEQSFIVQLIEQYKKCLLEFHQLWHESIDISAN